MPRPVVLIGESASKRADYFGKAASLLGVPFDIISWEEIAKGFDLGRLKGAAVKVDPPVFQTARLSQMKGRLEAYQAALQYLAQASCAFLNPPWAICQMLDKRATNQRLTAHGIPVTEMFPEEIRSVGQLVDVMQEKRCYSVFVKPRYFSGAAGVAAFRLHPGNGKMRLYTSCRLSDGQLINTKKLACQDQRTEVTMLLGQLLSLGCVVERWHPKAELNGKSYDLRVVFQFGHIAHIVARQSSGPVTNLHLNNQAVAFSRLGLKQGMLDVATLLCKKACAAYDADPCSRGRDPRKEASHIVPGGVNMVGFDLLVEKHTGNLRIIEMNGQGDLIYQDIYGENQIYREQVRAMKEFRWGEV